MKSTMKLMILGMAILCFLSVVGPAESTVDEGLSQKCMSQLQKVMMCLPFVTEKAATPSKECCNSATEMKDSDPACLCYIVQQIHSGASGDSIKSMGVKEARLLALPSACNLVNASISECPRLLHLSPNSPDAAIFTNTTSTTSSASTSPTSGTGTVPSLMPARSSSDGYPKLSASTIVVTAIFFVAFPFGLLSS